MKRLLLITYYFPPDPEAGALRPSYLAKYLPAHGWDTVVISPEKTPRGRTLLHHPNPGRRRGIRAALRRSPLWHFIRRLVFSIVYFPDAAIFWLPAALRDAFKRLDGHTCDVVMTTAMPATMHIAGAIVSRRLRVPWVADYRDLWSDNPYRRFGPVRTVLEQALEKYVLRTAAAVTTVSESLASSLRALLRREIQVIPNAVDASEWHDIEAVRPSDFRFCYGGRLYGGARSPEVLFGALAALRKQADPAGLNARVDFYGAESHQVCAMAERFGLQEVVTVHGAVPRAMLLKAERSAAVLVLLLRADPATSGEYGSKIFEYIGARRPILAIGARGSVVEGMLAQSGLGDFVTTVAECALAIQKLYRGFSMGVVEPRQNPEWKSSSAEDMAYQFSRVLDSVVSAG